MPTHEQLMEALQQVIDPELNYNIVDLGLVYRAEVENGKVEIDVTLTTPVCPLAPIIVSRITEKVAPLPGVEDIKVNLVFDPPWSIEKMNPSIRLELFPNWIPTKKED